MSVTIAMSVSMAKTVLIATMVTITIISLPIPDKLANVWFFQETFLLVNISMILGMPFLTFGSTNIWFAERKLVWKTYTAVKFLPTTKQIKLFSAKKFAMAALGNIKSLCNSFLKAKNIHPFLPSTNCLARRWRGPHHDFHQIFGLHQCFLSSDSTAELSKHTGIKNYPINLVFEVTYGRSNMVYSQTER